MANSSGGDLGDVVTGIIVLVAMLSGLVYLAFTLWRRHLVMQTSAAIAHLRSLNKVYASRQRWPKLRLDYADRVNSKAKFDRYDLNALFMTSIARDEEKIESWIAGRKYELDLYTDYLSAAGELAAEHYGKSSHKHLKPDAYRELEHKYFMQVRLDRPRYRTDVTATVRYTSPKGQNSYTKHLSWSFDELVEALDEMRELVAQRATTQYLRQQERNKVTAGVRAQVLKRDGSMCQMCGATPNDGVKLHVDHVVPVSRGGKSGLGNLQTLCVDCNLGKSNRH